MIRVPRLTAEKSNGSARRRIENSQFPYRSLRAILGIPKASDGDFLAVVGQGKSLNPHRVRADLP